MSRIGKQPIEIPAGVDVQIKGSNVKVMGPKGELAHTFPAVMSIEQDDGILTVDRPSDAKEHRSLHGMTRALIQNMVTGVSTGFEKILEVEGVGYRSEMSGSNLVLYVGYSHPVEIEPPDGIEFESENRGREIRVRGFDKQAVGQMAANIRKVRPPEPYKGKGIRYKGEIVRRKAGKSGR
ncbi:MAG TPA: 50S ribosomal protein L6 [Anaerolineales bacterium]|nr:50S ribosomal protein L6 [Anaerolineales bacterium]